jgi:hypothetical protein
MEQLKHSVRPYNAKQQHVQPLTKGPTYYRLRLDSSEKDAGSTNTEATYSISDVFPMGRADLLNGQWEVFVEGWSGWLQSQVHVSEGGAVSYRDSVELCLPEIVQCSNDYVMTDVGKCQTDDAIITIPNNLGISSALKSDNAKVDFIHVQPTHLRNVITADAVGHKIDPHRLFTGSLRVVLRDPYSHDVIATGDSALEITETESYTLTLLFVHKG